jgi:chemotaxis protein methyltransferase WspC
MAPAPTSADRSRALLAQGLHAADSGALADAVALFTSALELNGADADVWNSLGVVQHRQGDTAAAVEAFHRALRVNPGHAEVHRNLGVTLDRQGRAGDAASHYRAYLRLAADADPARPAVVRRLREMTASGTAP